MSLVAKLMGGDEDLEAMSTTVTRALEVVEEYLGRWETHADDDEN